MIKDQEVVRQFILIGKFDFTETSFNLIKRWRVQARADKRKADGIDVSLPNGIRPGSAASMGVVPRPTNGL